ncbi:MAG: hypothetical protein ACE5FI_01765 [Anaerolineales bacterium]
MRDNSQRLAWSVTIIAFAIFCLLAIAIPLGVRWFILNNTIVQTASAALTSGTVLLSRPDATLPEAVLDTITNLPEGARMETDPASQATVSFGAPHTGVALGTLQVYGSTDATLVSMRSPRFTASPRAHDIHMELRRGRMRVTVAVGVERPVVVTLDTPHATIRLERPGSYAVEVRAAESQVSVRDGAATVTAQGATLILAANERTIVPAGEAPVGVLRSERNLVTNGDFETQITDGWTTFQNRQEVNESAGVIEVTVHEGKRTVHFNRRGSNWSEAGITQVMNRDIRDVRSLQLHAAVWLAFQDLRNCGSLGSECPLMIRLEYSDTAGNIHEWLQGFYYLAATGNGTPARCVTCPPPTGEHLQVSNGAWFLFDSPNLMQLFASTGNAPATVNSISVYASGHNYESYVSEIELLTED